MSRILILQLRPETEASDDEYTAFLAKGGLRADQTHRLRLESETLPKGLDPRDYAGVIVGGGPGCVSDAPADKRPEEARAEAQILSLMPAITAHDLPFLGCCYGIGILAHHLGGTVNKSQHGEPVSAVTCITTPDGVGDPLLADLPPQFSAFVGHKEAVQSLPPGCTHLLTSGPCPFQMIRHGANVYATQFHPEADADGFATRIRAYKDRGYFPPDQADALIAMCHDSNVTWPERIIANFIRRYG
ncbi:glutamine amidotransferase [Puniceibacterium sp. IMCC21224]|uniref:glutamine amidotransferase n=1 Tax=Puniceibacterium sp. IMCC21224 TaxID=1618204 RepID=UPI00064DE1C6|nr:glutamine amidotransferase [Puniceibacterium sp. IMCC21224]KMK67804.1 GMP synthase family protein [Puniceibacterium sp. IMCC21224]